MASIESASREGKHFPHAAAKRTNFDALAESYTKTVHPEFDARARASRTRQPQWWAKQFRGLSLAEIIADLISKACDDLAAETFARGKPRVDKKTGETVAPTAYKRSDATGNRYIATLSHALNFAIKEPRARARDEDRGTAHVAARGQGP